MIHVLAAAALLAFTGSAAAQDIEVHPGWVLEGAAGTFYEQGVGNPAVAWDGSQYVMFFDTTAPAESPLPGCPEQIGLIGRATSADGLDWTVDPEPVLSPGQADWARCAVSSPAVVYTGERWHLFFKAYQGSVDANPPWGDRDEVGIGHAEASDGRSFAVRSDLAVEFQSWEDWSTIEHPTVVWYADSADDHYTWSMWLGRRQGPGGDIVLATSDDRGDSWQVRTDPVFSPGMAMWLTEAVYNPSVECQTGGGQPYTMHFGGQSPTSRAFGLATSPDGESWFGQSTAMLTFTDPIGWSGWDALRAGEHTVVWFAQADAQGHNRIGLAYTSDGPDWDRSATTSRVCGHLPVDTGNGGHTGDTGDTGPSDTSDTGLTGPQWLSGGCGCNRIRNRPDAWIALLGLPLLLSALRRRRP